ncbi:lipoprotein-releasing ABC transporter permease subunit [Gammaproteobacteria bacterium]|nr:lipoprotein-releasing ABC transporter permease subunit [Gammaproteobacteria bacterium]MDC0440549.1 lipoprotein-releasing ABC transporter permease subunit [Gammaproteobacteria bacterium]
MTSLPIYLGYKYFRSKKGAFASFTSLMAIAGLSLGVAALVIVLSVMNGFEKELQTRILGVVPQLIIRSHESLDNYDELISKLVNSDDVISASPYIETQGLMSAKNRSRGVFVTGIQPDLEDSMSILPQYITSGSLDNLSSKKGVIIGAWLARYLGTEVGDTVNITTTNLRSSILGTFPRTISLEIVGIFELKAELDQSLVLIHHDLAANLLNLPINATQGIRVKTADLFAANSLGFNLLTQPFLNEDHYYFTSWQQTHGTLFQAIKLEKRLISLMLFLIITVAAFNILSTIVMTVKTKEKEIAILKTMGCSQIQLTFIFINLGLIIGFLGTFIGLLIGIAVTPNIDQLINIVENFSNRNLMDSYFINYFPYEFRLTQIIYICLSVLLMSLAFSYFPAARASKLKPVTILRHE